MLSPQSSDALAWTAVCNPAFELLCDSCLKLRPLRTRIIFATSFSHRQLRPTPQVPQMKSLDAVKETKAHRPANAPRGQVPPRASNRAGSGRPRYASSVEEAKAAAEAAAKATAAKKALAAGAPTTTTAATKSAEAAAAPAADVQAPPAGLCRASESAPTAASAAGWPAPSSVVGGTDVETRVSGSLSRGEQEVAAMPSTTAMPEKRHEAPAAANGTGAAVEEELTADPFVRSQKLPRTPTPASAPLVKKTTAATASTAEVPAPSPRPSAGGNGGADGVLRQESKPEAVTPVPPECDKEGGGSPGPLAVGDPFASRSNIPRTPTDQVAPPHPQLSLFQQNVAAGGSADVEAMDLEGAREQIRELNQELACKRDSLAKQAEERKR